MTPEHAKREYHRKYYAANRERLCALAAAYRALNPEKTRAATDTWRAANKERTRTTQRRYNKLPEPTRVCPEVCEICAKSSKRALCLDHDHMTERFRGWICDPCNRGLGAFFDNPTLLIRAITYLERNHSC